jgi:outer membrane lipoprotein SlyB
MDKFDVFHELLKKLISENKLTIEQAQSIQNIANNAEADNKMAKLSTFIGAGTGATLGAILGMVSERFNNPEALVAGAVSGVILGLCASIAFHFSSRKTFQQANNALTNTSSIG